MALRESCSPGRLGASSFRSSLNIIYKLASGNLVNAYSCCIYGFGYKRCPPSKNICLAFGFSYRALVSQPMYHGTTGRGTTKDCTLGKATKYVNPCFI